jgi:hypothetical protein
MTMKQKKSLIKKKPNNHPLYLIQVDYTSVKKSLKEDV